MNMARMASRMLGRGSLVDIEPCCLRKDLKKANPEAILLIDLREFVLICLYSLALRKYCSRSLSDILAYSSISS